MVLGHRDAENHPESPFVPSLKQRRPPLPKRGADIARAADELDVDVPLRPSRLLSLEGVEPLHLLARERGARRPQVLLQPTRVRALRHHSVA